MIAALLSLFGATLISDLCCLLYLFEFTKMCFFYPRGVASQAKNHLHHPTLLGRQKTTTNASSYYTQTQLTNQETTIIIITLAPRLFTISNGGSGGSSRGGGRRSRVRSIGADLMLDNSRGLSL